MCRYQRQADDRLRATVRHVPHPDHEHRVAVLHDEPRASAVAHGVVDVRETALAAHVQALRMQRERLVVRALLPGDGLQVNARRGEAALSGAIPLPLVHIGNIDCARVRVESASAGPAG